VAAALCRLAVSVPTKEACSQDAQSPKAATNQVKGVPVNVFGVAWAAVRGQPSYEGSV